MNEEERVTKSTKLSAGRFRERWEETDIRKAVRVRRHSAGNESSEGSMGEYHHLNTVRYGHLPGSPYILYIVPNHSVSELSECGRSLWTEVGEVQVLASMKLHVCLVNVFPLILLLSRIVAPGQYPARNICSDFPSPSLMGDHLITTMAMSFPCRM
jgi:hypothetical protein